MNDLIDILLQKIQNATMSPVTPLEQLHRRHHRLNTCELKKTATRPVFGSGSPQADIVFIGEAPGKKEDETGIPFVGSAGKFLDELLQSIGLDRDTIYITNIVKYRPPNNRDPLPSEKESCQKWLSAELDYIKPKLVICLGRHALSYFFPTAKISLVHGKLIPVTDPRLPVQHLLPLYHPASALYNGSLRTVLKKDFKKIPRIIKKLTQTAQ